MKNIYFDEWQKQCQNVKNEFLNFMDAFIVSETLLGNQINVSEEKSFIGGKYTEFLINNPIEGVSQVLFYVLPGSKDINIDIMQLSTLFRVEEWEEFRELEEHDIKIIDLAQPNWKYVRANIDFDTFCKVANKLSNLWNFRGDD